MVKLNYSGIKKRRIMDEINNYRLEKLINVGAKIQNKGTLYMINGIS